MINQFHVDLGRQQGGEATIIRYREQTQRCPEIRKVAHRNQKHIRGNCIFSREASAYTNTKIIPCMYVYVLYTRTHTYIKKIYASSPFYRETKSTI